MAYDVTTTYKPGKSLYFFIFDDQGRVWDGSGFVAFTPNNWLAYVHPMTESALPGYYYATFPPTIGAGAFPLVGYEKQGSVPSPNDLLAMTGGMDWNGTTESAGGGTVEKNFTLFTASAEGVDISAGDEGVLPGIDIDTGVVGSISGGVIDVGVTPASPRQTIEVGVDGVTSGPTFETGVK